MDNQIEWVPITNPEIRERNPVSSVNISRESSMASSVWSTPYHERIDTDMDCNSTSGESNTECCELSYEAE